MKKEQKRLKNHGYLTDKKSWFVFVLQLQFLILSFVLILWGQKKLRALSEKSSSQTERKADFIAPNKALKE